MTQKSEMLWSIAVFSSRETVPQLLETISACRTACYARPGIIDVVVNGNAELAKELGEALGERSDTSTPISVRVWHLVLGDKAHAWNTYIYRIWPGGAVTFFIDGYVKVDEKAFHALEAALITHPHVMAATGIDVMGRSARRLAEFQMAISGIHGNLYSLRRETVLQIRSSAFRLPLGLYRTDPTLESCLKASFDPSIHAWDRSRVLVLPDVHWRRPVLSQWKWVDWLVHWRRMIRQAQGDVEQEALKVFWSVDKKRPSELPYTAAELIQAWIHRFPNRWRRLALANPLRLLAVRQLFRQRDWNVAGIPPTLIDCPRAET